MKLNVSVQLNLHTGEVAERIRKAASQALHDTAIAIAGDVVRLSPVQTGNNRRSIDYKIRELDAEVFSTSGYGGYLEIGTGLYGPGRAMITPKTKKILAWETKSGKWIFAKAVRGRPATPYFKPSLDLNFNQEKFASRVRDILGA